MSADGDTSEGAAGLGTPPGCTVEVSPYRPPTPIAQPPGLPPTEGPTYSTTSASALIRPRFRAGRPAGPAG